MAVVASLERQVGAALRRAGYSGNGSILVVAVSGGPDSSSLLCSLNRLREAHGLRLHVAHLNHDFRGDEADEDAQFVSAMAQELGLPSTVEKQDPTEYRRKRRISSFEQLAREMRYIFLAGVAEETGAAAVVVGHTADDQAETVLQHVLRGSGLHGLKGMAEVSPWPWPIKGSNLRLFRPLLGVTKAETVAYCQALGRSFRDDSGNYLPRFTRNRVRHDLLPALTSGYNPRVRESLARLARTAAVDLDFIEGEVSRLWPQLAEVKEGAVRFDLQMLAGLHPALQRMLMRRGYSILTGGTRRLRESHLNDMADMIVGKATGSRLELPEGVRLHRSYQHLLLSKDAGLDCPLPDLDGEHPLALPSAGQGESVLIEGGWRITLRVDESPNPSFEQTDESEDLPGGLVWSARLDRAALSGRLLLRTRRPGDRFRPLGMRQEKKLQDFFTDAKVPRAWRDSVPLLVSEQGIAWVVGYRIADWAAPARELLSGQSTVVTTFEIIYTIKRRS